MSPEDLKRFALLAELGEEDREALLEVLEEKRVSRGVALFREGSEAEGLVLLVEGRATLESRRTERSLEVGPGTSFGALSLVAVGPREITAIAQAPCRYWLLPRTSFRRLAEDAPRTACRLAEAIVSEASSLLREGLDRVAAVLS